MNDTEKLSVVLIELSSIFHLNDEYINLIKENILLRSSYYHNIDIDFSDETIYIKDSSSSLDFFINRLINNIRDYSFNNVYNPNNNEKEEYNFETQVLKISNPKVFGEITRNKIINRNPNVDDKLLNKVYKKIMAHEFGHAFQTSFTGVIGKNDTRYKQLVNNLNSKYPDTFIIPKYEGELTIKQDGLIPTLIEDGKHNIREYYSNKERIILIDDIMNEDESLMLFNDNEIQGKYNLGMNCYKNVYNYESNNYKITSYASMMKLILGDNKTFKTMYKNGIEFYEFFDQFDSIATEVFKYGIKTKKPVVSCILDALDRLKKNNSLRDAINLDLFFSKCLQKRINYFVNQNPTHEEIKDYKRMVGRFMKLLTICDNGKLDHEYVIDEIKKVLNNY